MTEYGVQTNNIFDLLNTADDAAKPAAKPKARKKKSQRGPQGGQAPAPAGGAAVQPKKDQPAAVKPAAPRPASSQPRNTTVTVSGGRGSVPRGTAPTTNAPLAASGGRGNGGGRGASTQPRPQPPRQTLARGTEEFVRKNDASHVSFAEEKGKADTGRHEGGQAKQTNAPRGREHDRHSGTGRSPVENKKAGGGQGNWGKNSAEDELAAIEDAKVEAAAESPEAKKDEKKKKKKKGKKPEEEEEKDKKDEIPDEQLKTLEDFLKERDAKAVKRSLPPARAAGEGVKADPKWAEAVKREDADEVFLKVKEEPKKEQAEDSKKPTKSSLRKKRKKEAKEQAAKKLAEDNISSMFDFSAKKENDFPRGGPRRGGPREGGQRGGPREGGRGERPFREPREGGQRGGPREGGQRGPPREGGQRGGPREGGQRAPRGTGNGGPNRSPQPRKYKPGNADGAPQFDASAFPALQVGPPPITVD